MDLENLQKVWENFKQHMSKNRRYEIERHWSSGKRKLFKEKVLQVLIKMDLSESQK